MNRVVITGMGIWSCLGTDIDKVKEALYLGKSGIGVEQDRLTYGYQSGLTGIVEHPQLKGKTAICGVACRRRPSMPIWPRSRLST